MPIEHDRPLAENAGVAKNAIAAIAAISLMKCIRASTLVQQKKVPYSPCSIH
jgi:hypothetical protein